MKWIRQVALDLLVTAVLLIAVVLSQEWAWWVIALYTPIMLLMKVAAVLLTSLLTTIRRPETDVPEWFFHALYGINVVALLYARWWLLAAGWIAIWILSILAGRKLKAPSPLRPTPAR